MMWSRDTRWHWGLAVGQVALLTWICLGANVWGSTTTSKQFPGHLGPSAFIMAIGVTALTCDWGWKQRAIVEGKLSITAAVVYVSGETLIALVSKGHRLASFYVKHGLHAWMSVVIGLCGVLLVMAPNLDKATGFRMRNVPHLLFSVAWAWFIFNHKQPNDFGIDMHWSATVWILAGGTLRTLSLLKESGAAYIMAAYMFFGGQMGLTIWAVGAEANIGSYIMAWHALPITAIIVYSAVFCKPRLGNSLGALTNDDAVMGDDEEAPLAGLPRRTGKFDV